MNIYSSNGNVKTNFYKTIQKSKVEAKQVSNVNFSSNAIAKDSFCLSNSAKTNNPVINELKNELEQTKNSQGLIGKTWDGIKNLFGAKAGSNQVEKVINQLEKGKISEEEARAALEKYKDGQQMSVDVAGDIISGIVSVGAIALAPVTGGASLLLAAGVGAATKVGIKAVDCLIGGRKYGIKDFGYDIITGSINGAMAPITNALGGAAGTGVAKACGLNFVKAAGKEAAEEGAKAAGKSFLTKLLANQGTEYVAKAGQTGIKTVLAKMAAYGTDMAVDGAISGATDGFARSLASGDFENMGKNMKDGFVGGLIASPIIGGGFKVAGKAGSQALQKASSGINAGIAGASLLSAPVVAKQITGAISDSAIDTAAKESSSEVAEAVAKNITPQNAKGVQQLTTERARQIAGLAPETSSELLKNLDIQRFASQPTKIDATQQQQELVDVLSAILHKKTANISNEFSLSDDVIRRATELLADPGTPEYENLLRLAKECFVSIKDPEEIKALLTKQFISLSDKGDTTIILNPSKLDDANRSIGTSNKYICQWCADAIGLAQESIFDATQERMSALQALINSSSGKKITILVPDDFSGSGRSLSMNTIGIISQLEIPSDVTLDIVLAPATATSGAKKVFKAISEGNLPRLKNSGALEQGGKNPDLPVLKRFFENKGNNVQIRSSEEIYRIPTIYETSTFKNLSQDEQQAIEIILTSNGSHSGLTGYGRDNKGFNATMASFPGINPETGKLVRKSPNNNLSGAMPYALTDGVNIEKIKPPGGKISEKAWTDAKDKVVEELKK